MSAYIDFRSFQSRETASAAAADLLEADVAGQLDSNPQAVASMVVSGGSTPGPCFDLLSAKSLDWSRVVVIPSDERWVASDHTDSNERLIRARLLKGRANEGKVLSFFRRDIEASQAPEFIEQDLGNLTRPFSVSLLGMGEDGHFASLFPDFEDLQKALDPQGSVQCITVQTEGSPHLRISLTLAALLDSAHLVLLIFGEAKRVVFEAAKNGGSSYPIESLLLNVRSPLTVIWAP